MIQGGPVASASGSLARGGNRADNRPNQQHRNGYLGPIPRFVGRPALPRGRSDARDTGCPRYFFASSACVYSTEKQTRADPVPLKETDAYPAMPEDGYGWEKLFGERMCRHFSEDFRLATRVARYHNVYGPHGSYDGGREKACLPKVGRTLRFLHG